MIKPVAIVDLFSGPGGLGEGFSACIGPRGQRRYQIELSIEKEPSAHRTLLLRSFLRKFDEGYPSEYHEFLNDAGQEPDWAQLYPEQWRTAKEETWRLELGRPDAATLLGKRIREIHSRYGGRTVLIGGPPCQAYSLAGRGRIAGGDDHLLHKDQRTYLYREYVGVLSKLRPAAAVMENVKGMLSLAVRGDHIFLKVLEDLRGAAGPGSYRLFALSPSSGDLFPSEGPVPKDFIVRTERHGIPQARHRVIVLALRRDVAEGLPAEFLPRLERLGDDVCVKDVIGEMPKLRSGLSRNDGPIAWKGVVQDACEKVGRIELGLTSSQRLTFQKQLYRVRQLANGAAPLFRRERPGTDLPASCPPDLRNWLQDGSLKRLPNNDTRGHMASDLARYLFAAAFGKACGRSPKAMDFPDALAPDHMSWASGKFSDRFRVQLADRPSSTITSHISKDGHYYIHPDPAQCRSLTVREAARLQTFPDNYLFKGNRTEQYVQVGNAVPPFLAFQIAECLWKVLEYQGERGRRKRNSLAHVAGKRS